MRNLAPALGWLALSSCATPRTTLERDDAPAPSPATPSSWRAEGAAWTQHDRPVHAAQITLPSHADLAFAVEDRATGMRVEVSLPESTHAPAEVTGDTITYRDALGTGRDLIQRRTAAGVEDFVGVGDEGATSIRYAIRLTRGVASLRLVGDTLEMLDASGAPRLRAARPRVLDEDGNARPVRVALHGCAFDADTRAPWGRALPPPGSDLCTLELAWTAADRARWIDPGWESTASMAIPRSNPMVTTLSDERVLAVGGYPADLQATDTERAEIFDPATATWALSASMPVAVTDGTLTGLDGGRALVVGGFDVGSSFITDRAYVFDGVTFVARSLPHDLGLQAAVRLADGRVLLLGGIESAVTDEILVFDPQSDTFSLEGTLPYAACSASATRFESGGKEYVLLAGGRTNTQINQRFISLANTVLIDTSDLSTQIMPSMPRDRADLTLARWGTNKIVAIGGVKWSVGPLPDRDPIADALVEVDAFDVDARTWTQIASLPEPWAVGRSKTASDGTVMTLGGCTLTELVCAAYYTDTYRLDLAGAWSVSGQLSAARALVGSAELSGDRWLAVGGEATSVVYPNVDLFQPSQNGEPCMLSGECASAQCVEGVCCDTACGGACESCLAAVKESGTDGTCGPTPRHSNPKGACKVAGDCTREACDGAAACAPVLEMCAPYQCAATSGCLSQCVADADCQQGFACYGGQCIGTADLCVGSAGTDRTTGQSVDCAPYLCVPDGSCRTSCASSDQCAEGRVCNQDSRCVAPPSAEEEEKKTEEEGCSVHPTRDGRSWLPLVVAAWFVGATRRRGRRKPRVTW